MPDPEHPPTVAEEPAADPQAPAVEVPLTKTPEAAKPAELSLTDIAKALEDLKKQFNGVSYTVRQLKDKPPVVTPTVATTPQTADVLEKLLEDGKTEEYVERVAEKKFEAKWAAKEAEQYAEREAAARRTKYASAEAEVLSVYPELNSLDQHPEIAAVWSQAISANPDLLQEVRGPVLMMREMEKLMAAQGQQPRSYQRVTAESRLPGGPKRPVGVTPITRPGSSAPTYTLTREQKEFCDANGIKYEHYAKHAASGAAPSEVDA